MTQAVRPATADDAAAIATIHVRGWQAAYRGLVPDRILDGFDVAQRAAHWERRIAARPPDDGSRVWVIEDDGAVTGFAAAGPGRDESAPPPEGAGEVYAIYLEPDRIGAGHGRALFARTVDDLIARGFDPIVVWVFETNPRARRFYEAAGFHLDGARHDIDFDGEPIPEIRYRLDAAGHPRTPAPTRTKVPAGPGTTGPARPP